MALGHFKAVQRSVSRYDLTLNGEHLPNAYAFTIEHHVGELPTVTVSFRATAEVIPLEGEAPHVCTHPRWTTIHNGPADDTTRTCDDCGADLNP